MLRRLPGVRLRLARLAARGSRVRRDQAHRRRALALPRVVLLLPVVLGAGLLLALRPGDITRAMKPSTWTPLPATVFGSLPLPGVPSPRSHQDRADERSPQNTSDSNAGQSATPARGRRDSSVPPAVSAGNPGGASVTVRGGGPDAPSVTAIVRATPTPVPTPVPAPKGPTHVVATGDNLWTISRRHSADLASILRWNEGVDPDRLMAGERILVPGGSKMKPLPKPAVVTSRAASVRPATTDRAAAPRTQDGAHLWPLPIRGDLTRGFSAAHPAIDIAAPRGTRVRAIADGTVMWSGWKNNGGGYVVEIVHPDGMRSTYNHNSKVTVARGDEVAQGDTIALVGSTGWSTGPHLDLRIRMGGRLVDPLRVY